MSSKDDLDTKFESHLGTFEDVSKLKLDSYGLPLIPQPSDDPSDPLTWPKWLKIAILLQVSAVAFITPFNSAVINPAYVPLAAQFHKTLVEASYQTAVTMAFVSIGPFIWVPLGNVYGRRPVLLLSTIGAAASMFGAGKAATWSQLIVARVFNGLLVSAGPALAPAVVVDTFFLHERGRAMGVFVVVLSNSAHLAAIPGGFLGQFVSYRWCFYLAAVIDLTIFVIILFCLPETIYVRGSKPVVTDWPILRRLKFWNLRPAERHLKLESFWRPFVMFKYLAVIFPSWYAEYVFTLSSVLPAVTSANLLNRLYKFNASQTGLVVGVSTLTGTFLGELLGGVVIDRSMRISRKKSHEVVPEVRLHGIWLGMILVPIGLLIWGFCIQFKTVWAGVAVAIGIANFGAQIVSTVAYSYCADCYKPQTPEIGLIFNFAREVIGMTVSFWAIPFGDAIGFHLMSVVLVIIMLLSALPIIYLMKWGKDLRRKQGEPTFNKEL